MVCREDSPWDWNYDHHKHLLIKEYLPAKFMKEHQSKIISAMNDIYRLWQSTRYTPADTRFCITINGRASTHKTTLAKLIVAKMAENNIVNGGPKSWIIWPTPKSADKLPPTRGKEVIIFDDYNGAKHNWYIFDLFTMKDTGEFGTKGSHEQNTLIKGAIYPSVKTVETWISEQTENLIECEQLLRRTNCSLHIFEKVIIPPCYSEKITWNHYKDRLFNVGPVRKYIYETVIENAPKLRYEPLYNFGKTAFAYGEISLLI